MALSIHLWGLPMPRVVRCSFCGKSVSMSFSPYKHNLKKFNVQTIKQLGNVYLCKTCRILKRLFDTPAYLKVSGPYRRLKYLIQQEVNIYVKRGILNPEARANFLANVKTILDKQHIKDYDYIVNNNDLKGVMLKNIPFFDKVVIEINTKGKNERKKTND